MNDTERAIDVLKRLRIATVADRVDGFRIFKPLSIAIAALEKQLPKAKDNQGTQCGNCYAIIQDIDNYCFNCGQRLED